MLHHMTKVAILVIKGGRRIFSGLTRGGRTIFLWWLRGGRRIFKGGNGKLGACFFDFNCLVPNFQPRYKVKVHSEGSLFVSLRALCLSHEGSLFVSMRESLTPHLLESIGDYMFFRTTLCLKFWIEKLSEA